MQLEEGVEECPCPWAEDAEYGCRGGLRAPSKYGAVLKDRTSRSALLLKGEGCAPFFLPRGGVLLWQWRAW